MQDEQKPREQLIEELKECRCRLAQVETLLNERDVLKGALAASEQALRTIFDSVRGVIYVIDLNRNCITLNAAFERLTGWRREDWIGKSLEPLIHPDDLPLADARLSLLKEMRDAAPLELRVKMSSGEYREFEFVPSPLFENGELTAVLGIARDITERKETEEKLRDSLHEKETLLREIHHRVKNNMQVIYSLLNMQRRGVEDQRVSQLLAESQSRVRAMALVHETLYSSGNLARVSLGDYASRLVRALLDLYRTDKERISVRMDVEEIRMEVEELLPCGLILNELISNALKYAFPEERPGEITISGRHRGEMEIELGVTDNGVGLPEDLDPRNADTVGLSLASGLALKQLGGAFEVERGIGTRFTIRFAPRSVKPAGS